MLKSTNTWGGGLTDNRILGTEIQLRHVIEIDVSQKLKQSFKKQEKLFSKKEECFEWLCNMAVNAVQLYPRGRRDLSVSTGEC